MSFFKQFEGDPQYQKYRQRASLRIKLAQSIYNQRKQLIWSQGKLAREAETTQKVISMIENAEVNVGFDLLQRILIVLGLSLKIGSTDLIIATDNANDVIDNSWSEKIPTKLNSRAN